MATAFWIADGEKYIKEAQKSAASLRRYNPDVRLILFTPQHKDVDGFDEVRALPKRESEFWFVDAVRYFGLAVQGIKDERQLYLDTDTYTCVEVMDLFTMLDKFDFTGAHAPGRRTAGGADEVPPAFPEINVGVNGIKRSSMVLYFLDKWLEWIEKDPRNNDQPALRATLWEMAGSIRLGVLPPEYNCRWGFGGFARYPVKILHGRGDYGKAKVALNRKVEMRGWARGTLP